MSVSRKLFFTCFTSFFILGLVELVLYLAKFDYDRSQIQTDIWVNASNEAIAQDAWFDRLRKIENRFDTTERPDWFLEYDSTLLWRARAPSIAFSINEQGFRNATVPIPKPRGEFRILLLGDSVAWGYQADIRETYAHRLEKYLNEGQYGTFRVINAGVPGYSSEQGRRYFQNELTHLEPDLIIVSFGRNDYRHQPIQWQGLTDRQLIEKRQLQNQTTHWIQSLRIFQLVSYLTDNVWHLFPDTFQPEKPQIEFDYHNVEMDLDNALVRIPRDDFVDNIHAIYRNAQSLNATFMLLTMPVNPEVVGNYNAELRILSSELAVPLVDMDAVFRKQNDYPNLLIDECHLTVSGHELFAEYLREAVISLIIPSSCN